MEDDYDIDILLTLNPHGWSTCWIIKERKNFELVISHVFGDPYFDLIQALTGLINNKEEVTFFWYREPGGEKIEISRIKERRHEVRVLISGFQESFEEAIKDFKPTVEFQIKLKQLIIIMYFQLRKTFVLLKDKEYSKNRPNSFPFEEYMKFEKLASEYLGLKK
ncbi:hypothetical protein [Adhaeribacter pallidiroseus]|uniref:Uncharacterized protein n=1 Tax=Adhaeribacter pallidiroseus TaxID=2072847 RepID=A0A369QGN2_9BACT|nr:hypothetical protein [Adhaeribacter pallidiroseus]RDC61448.1 hypothetical protein AHMF7616_00027 [Adhaeribacter pallidiroseus]